MNKIDIVCIKTAYRLFRDYELIVLDEIHTCLSPQYRNVFNGIAYLQIMGLTATAPHNEEYREYLNKVCPIIYEKTTEDAVAISAISDYTIYNLEVGMSRKDRGRYQLFDKLLKRAQMEIGILKRYDDNLRNVSIFDIAKQYSNSKTSSPMVKYAKQFWSSMSMRK